VRAGGHPEFDFDGHKVSFQLSAFSYQCGAIAKKQTEN